MPGPFATPYTFSPDTYAQSGQVNANSVAVAAFINACLNNVTYGTGAPSTLFAENAVYFDTSQTPWVAYVQHSGVWTRFLQGAWRIQGTSEGGLTGNQEIFKIPTYGDENLPAGLPGSRGGCEVAPTGNVTFTLYKSGTSIGTMNIASGQTVATFTFTTTVYFSNTDTFSLNAPSSTDATLSTPYWCFAGGRA